MFFVVLLLGALVEVVAGLAVADRIGAAPTVLLILACSAFGSVLLRRVTAAAVLRVRRAAATTGRPPVRELVDAVNGFAGALLITAPGLVSTALGLVLLAPPLRPLARRLEARLLRRRIAALAGLRLDADWQPGAPDGTTPNPATGGGVIEGVVVEEHLLTGRTDPPTPPRPDPQP